MNRCMKIAFLNSKGGVGKTTTAVNTAVALAELGHRVLLVDVDAQSHVASHLGMEVDAAGSIDAVLLTKYGKVSDVVQSSPYPNLDVVLSTHSLDDVEKVLLMRNQPLDALWRAMKGLQGYDVVLIDCAPNLGTLTRCAMRVSDKIVIPTDLDSFSVEGMDRLGDRIVEMQEDFGEDCANVLGVLITKYDRSRSVENRANYDVLEQAFGGDQVFFKSRIRIDERCKRAKRKRQSVVTVKGSRAAEDYRSFAGEVAEKLELRVA